MPRIRKTLRVPSGKSFLHPTAIARGQHEDRWFDGPCVVRVRSLNDLEKRLNKRGFERVGSGAFGYAMAKGQLVWKCGTRARFDEGYKRYVWGVVNGLFDRQFMPRIKLVLIADDGAYAVLMERLKTVGHKADERTRERVNHSLYPEYYSRERGARFDPIAPLMKLGRKIREFGQMWGFSEDLHDGNWMLRRDGRIVLTDPLA